MVSCRASERHQHCFVERALRIRKNAAGEIEIYKRLAACGFTQIHGVGCYKTYAPVAQFASFKFRILLAMASRNGWPADSCDFDSAYRNPVLSDDEVIYLEQPPQISSNQCKGQEAGVSWTNPRKRVFRLHKALTRSYELV